MTSRGRRPLTHISPWDVANKYNEGMTDLKELSQFFGCSPATINFRLLVAGITPVKKNTPITLVMEIPPAPNRKDQPTFEEKSKTHRMHDRNVDIVAKREDINELKEEHGIPPVKQKNEVKKKVNNGVYTRRGVINIAWCKDATSEAQVQKQLEDAPTPLTRKNGPNTHAAIHERNVEIVARRIRGVSISTLSIEYGLTESLIRGILSRCVDCFKVHGVGRNRKVGGTFDNKSNKHKFHERNMSILSHRNEGATLNELATEFGLTHQRIQQIIKKCVACLKSYGKFC